MSQSLSCFSGGGYKFQLLGLAGSYSWACPIINGTFKSMTSGLSLNVSSSVDENQIVTYDISSVILGKSTYIAYHVTRIPLGIREYTSYVTVSCPDDDLLIDTDTRMTADKSSFWLFLSILTKFHFEDDFQFRSSETSQN
jgi:hypothetical protein